MRTQLDVKDVLAPLRDEIIQRTSALTPAQSGVMAASLLRACKITNTDASKSLDLAVKLALIAAVRGFGDASVIEAEMRLTIARLKNSNFDDEPAAEPEESPYPSCVSNPHDAELAPAEQPQASNGDFPSIEVPEPPPIEASPTDPMSVIAKGVLPHLAPRWRQVATFAAADALNRLRPVFDGVRSELTQLASRPSGGADAAEVERILDKHLNNGMGEKLRAAAEPEIRKAMTAILDDAKARVTVVDTPEDVTLEAAIIPDSDPNYSWTDSLESLAKMLNEASAESPQNVLLTGPSGCGKTQFASEFAAKYGRPMMVMDCANVREARDWFGQKGAQNGSTYFRRSQFWMAVEAGNCVILLDEFNRASDHVRNTLMPILDHRRSTFVEEVGETLKVGPRTVFMATLNEGLDYSGTHTTDRAMKNRFPRRVELTYLPEAKEIEVLMGKVKGLKQEDARRLVEAATAIRLKAAEYGGGLSETISTRQLIAIAYDLAISGPESLKYTVFSHFSADGGTTSERAQVISTFEGKGFSVTT